MPKNFIRGPRTRWAVTLLVALGALTPATAQMSREDAMKLAEKYRGQLGGTQVTAPEPIELRDADVRGFVAAVGQLRELGVELELAGEKTDTVGMARALEANQRAYGILKANGFDPERFQRVTYSIAMALAKVDGDIDDARLDQARQAQAEAMEKMKSRLTPDQYAAMQRTMGSATAALDQFADQPPGNVELVRTHREALRKVIEQR